MKSNFGLWSLNDAALSQQLIVKKKWVTQCQIEAIYSKAVWNMIINSKSCQILLIMAILISLYLSRDRKHKSVMMFCEGAVWPLSICHEVPITSSYLPLVKFIKVHGQYEIRPTYRPRYDVMPEQVRRNCRTLSKHSEMIDNAIIMPGRLPNLANSRDFNTLHYTNQYKRF